MIRLVLAMVWTRRGQAVTLALLALFAVAAAVASPAYLIAADRAVAAGQIATATPAERGLVISGTRDNRLQSDGPAFTDIGDALLNLPGFTFVYAAEYDTIGIEPDKEHASRFVFRQDVCAHVTMVTGRCLIGEGDVIIGTGTAKRLELAAGYPITLGAARFEDDPRHPQWSPDGVPKSLTIAGTYTVADPDETYWGTHRYFATIPGLGLGEPVFTSQATMTGMDHGATDMSIDGTAGAAALDIDRLPALREGLAELKPTADRMGASIQVNTDMPEMLDRIDAGRSATRLIIPVLAVPLVLLACFSIFLAVSYGTQGRQPELAVVALRGSRWWMRWWLATGESLAAILAGALVGCVAGQLLVNAVAAARFPGVGADPDWSSLRYAPVAAAAALVAAVLAQRRQLLSPVAVLLRRNPVAANGPRALAVELLIVLLAVVSAVQLAISGGTLTGVGLLAPAFLMLALALLAARALLPAVTRYAGRALDGGRLGIALAGFQLSRRPGAQRLFALIVATVAVAGYAAAAIDVAARGRAVSSGLGVGAARVLDIQRAYRSQLLHAVRAVDPDGRYAMAVSRLPNSAASEPLGLAVDSSRLAAVATWPAGGPSATEVARRLHPPAAEPLVFGGQDITVLATGSGIPRGEDLRLILEVSSLAGLGDKVIELGEVHQGRWEYSQRVGLCAKGCRLNGIQFIASGSIVGVTGTVVIDGIGTKNPSRMHPPGDAAQWRMPRFGRLSSSGDGLRIDVDGPGGLPGGAWVQPVDTPYPLPIAYAGEPPIGKAVTGIGGEPLPVDPVRSLPAVPRLGVHATLVDLDYADRLAVDSAPALQPQIWLNDKAPADILDRISAQGLIVTGDTLASQVRKQLDEQGPALALWFYVLAGVLSVLLGAGALVLAAAVDRSRRVEDLSALRVQGMSRPAVSRATLWTYPVLVAIAAVVGAVIGWVTWALTGWALPLAGLDTPPLPLPSWPALLAIPVATLGVLVLLAVVAALTGRDLRSRIDRGDTT
nr:FtsX-like permease family protein [uncultured Actinoplanes sp.]